MSSSPIDTAAAGDTTLEDRLVGFFELHYARMTRLAGLVCHDAAAAEDAVQAAMERAWRRRGSLRDRDRMRWWLDRIVVREAIRINRSRPYRHAVDRLTDVTADRLHDPRDRIGPLRLMLHAAFGRISVEQRATVVLHLHLGYSVPETAQLMGVSVETTRSRLRLARQRLRRELEEDAR